jgi:hypothetical protein
MNIGTNLSRKEIVDLENGGFHLPQRAIISPRRLFGMEELPFDLSSYHLEEQQCAHNETYQQLHILSNLTRSSSSSDDDPSFRIWMHIILDSEVPPKVQDYLITIGSFPECSCQYFKDMATKALGKRGQWKNYKHLYFVFIVIGSLDSNRDAFIHVLSFSLNEVKRILESGILANCIP